MVNISLRSFLQNLILKKSGVMKVSEEKQQMRSERQDEPECELPPPPLEPVLPKLINYWYRVKNYDTKSRFSFARVENMTG